MLLALPTEGVVCFLSTTNAGNYRLTARCDLATKITHFRAWRQAHSRLSNWLIRSAKAEHAFLPSLSSKTDPASVRSESEQRRLLTINRVCVEVVSL